MNVPLKHVSQPSRSSQPPHRCFGQTKGMNPRNGWRTIMILLACLSSAGAFAVAALSPAETLFDRALDVLKNNYFGYSSLNTDRLRESFQPKLEAVCKSFDPCPYDAVSGVVSEMIASLSDPHTYRLTPEQTGVIEADFAGTRSINPQFGMSVAEVPDAAMLVVKRVLEAGPAAVAGFKRGDTIMSINDQPLELFDSGQAAISNFKALERDGNATVFEILRDQKRLKLSVTAQRLDPWLPQLEVLELGSAGSGSAGSGSVGVITFFQFKAGGQVANRVHDLVRRAQSLGLKTLILDVRDSAGGLVSECLGSVGAFLEPVRQMHEFRYGRIQFEYAKGRFAQLNADGSRSDPQVIVNNPSQWTGGLIVLTNARAKSAPEYLAYLLQRHTKTRVIGEPTLGALNTSNGFFALPDKSSMAVSMGRALESDGTPYPARVTPDQTVNDDPANLATGHDLPLEAALKLLE
jgi:carboxyl-terminal processing protease